MKILKNNPTSWANPTEHFLKAITHPWYKCIFSLLSEINYATTDFFRERGFASALMPITTQSISSPMGLGSDSLPVSVKLRGQKTYLADSMQFQLEYLLRHGNKGVFYIMPTFRGEDHDTRHLNEFFHSEAEIQGNLNDVMDLIEEYISFLGKSLLQNCSTELSSVLGSELNHIHELTNIKQKIKKISFDEAFEILKDDETCFLNLPGGLKTLSRFAEKKLMEKNHGFVWLTYPNHKIVPFYQAFTEDKKYAKSADLCFGIGETIGCGERHVGILETHEALKMHKVPIETYEWYCRMKNEFPMKTSGFGLGIERFLAYLLKCDDIRELQIFPRLKGLKHAP